MRISPHIVKKMSIKITLALIALLKVCCTEAGFTQGAPCSPRNTATIREDKVIFSREPVECIDMAGMQLMNYHHLKTLSNPKLAAATTLYANDMNINYFPKYLQSFPNLQVLDLSNNAIRLIPFDLGKYWSHLKILLLENNQIHERLKRPLIRSKTIDTLKLSGNNLKSLKWYTFIKLPLLRVLFLDNNKIESVSEIVFSRLNKLKFLDLSGNLMKMTPPMEVMPKSLVVYIRENSDIEIEE